MRYLRLKKKKDIARVLKTGKRAYAETLAIVYLPAEQTQMAVCVGKKFGKSVQRNRIKRLLREAFARWAEELAVPCSFLLLPKQAQSYGFAPFLRDIGKILKRESLIEN